MQYCQISVLINFFLAWVEQKVLYGYALNMIYIFFQFLLFILNTIHCSL